VLVKLVPRAWALARFGRGKWAGNCMSFGKVLIADSDRAVVQAIEAQIRPLGLEPLWTPDGQQVIDSFIRRRPEAVILRDRLPDADGWEMAELIRAISDAPIIMLSDTPDRLTRQRALQVGDDILSPPWRWERLPARLDALLKRPRSSAEPPPDRYDDGYLMVDLSGRVVTRLGATVDLNYTEFKLLSCFVAHPNQALSYGQLLQRVWLHGYLKARSDVSQHVRYLRQKIEINHARPVYFRSIRGIGYLFSSGRHSS